MVQLILVTRKITVPTPTELSFCEKGRESCPVNHGYGCVLIKDLVC